MSKLSKRELEIALLNPPLGQPLTAWQEAAIRNLNHYVGEQPESQAKPETAAPIASAELELGHHKRVELSPTKAKSSAEKSETELLTLPEAAKMLRVKVSTLRAWRTAQKLPFVKLNGKVLLRRSDLERLIEASLVPAAGNNRKG